MPMDPWYKVVTPREEVREGRSFNPDEFAIDLAQVVNGTAPRDYRDPEQFFSRTFFTQAMTEHTGTVLRRLSGRTESTAPVLSLVTQFGGGKTHTLTALYHLAKSGQRAGDLNGVQDVLKTSGVTVPDQVRVATFVGSAWDPAEGKETPWIDVIRQISGAKESETLGASFRNAAPGTETLGNIFREADAPVLILFDEVLNFINRYPGMADQFYSFLQNLTVSVAGTTHVAAVVSLPRSQVEMTETDREWQERITKVINRVAQDLIANDETEISEVVRRRLFENLGSLRTRQRVSKAYADWCFERSARLPSEWTAVDTATNDTRARDFLQRRFEACYPFHPATLSVFQRKWSALPQFQKTRGALAMLAQWISSASSEQFKQARNEPLITLGSAPLHIPSFRETVLAQLGERRLSTAIDVDLAGETARSKPLDADAKGSLRDIHKRVGTAMLFESSGGMIDRVAHLPELRFALGEPDVETTTIDNAAAALAETGFFIRRAGADGYRIHHQATLRKAVADLRASLDGETEVKPAIRKLVEQEFSKGTGIQKVYFPEDSTAVSDDPRMTLVVMNPDEEWREDNHNPSRISQWTRERGRSPRLYPAALVWCIRKSGRDLRDKVELWLAWQKVKSEIDAGTMGPEFERRDLEELGRHTRNAEEEAVEEVSASYRHVALQDSQTENGLKTIDLGAGYAGGNGTLTERVVAALKANALLNESVGASYIERHWPPALKDSGTWPLRSLRQSFLNGSLTRLLDPDRVLRQKIAEFVENGDFGLASGEAGQEQFTRKWYCEKPPADEVNFDSGTFLITRAKAEQLSAPKQKEADPEPQPDEPHVPTPDPAPTPPGGQQAIPIPQKVTLRIRGTVPYESWNMLGTRILPKIRSGEALNLSVDLSVQVDAPMASNMTADVQQALEDLKLDDQMKIE